MAGYRSALLGAALLSIVATCGEDARGTADDPRERFWAEVNRLCGHSFGGQVEEAPSGDTLLTGKALVMHVRSCAPDEVRIAFNVGEDRSRTWVLTRTDSTLALSHDHRHEDGSPAENTGYGGVTTTPGTATLQEFPADARTAERSPRTRTNVWSISVEPGLAFTYGLDRLGTDRRFRVRFDLTDTVPRPPPSW